MGCVVPLFALVWYTLEQTVENAAVRWSRVLVSIVSACPIWMATSFYLPRTLLEGRDEGGGVILGLLRVFLVESEVSGEPNFYEDEGA